MFAAIKNENTTPSNSPERVPEVVDVQNETDDDDEYGRNERAKSILPKLLEGSQRVFGGLEYIVECQDKNLGDSPARFYCRMCQACFEMNTIAKHCSNFVHLFRYIQTRFPIFYSKITELKELPRRIKIVKDLCKLYSRVTEPKTAETVLLNNLEGAFYDHVYMIDDPLVNIEYTDVLNDLNENEERSLNSGERFGTESLFENVKRCLTLTTDEQQSSQSTSVEKVEETPSQSKITSVVKPEPMEVQNNTEETVEPNNDEECNNDDKFLTKARVLIDQILKNEPLTFRVDAEFLQKFVSFYKSKKITFKNDEEVGKVKAGLEKAKKNT